MIRISFLAGELFFTGIWLLARLFIWLRQKRIDWKCEAVLLLMYINLAVILRFTFFPMARVGGKVRPLLFDPAKIYPFRVNLRPLTDLLDYKSRREMLLNVLGNAGMFVPSGIVLPVVYKKLDSLWKVTAVGFLLSLCIELLQLPFSVRATDVDDLIMNTLGVMLGYGIYALVRALKNRKA